MAFNIAKGFSFKRLRKRLLGPPATASYKQYPYHAYTHVRDLPLFTFETIRHMLIDPTLRLGLAMRAAPLHGCEFAYPMPGLDGKRQWVPGIKADRPDVARFVEKQLQRIWRYDLHKILSAQTWGWSAGEVTFRLRDGMVQVDRILSRQARDVFALRDRNTGKTCGVRFTRLFDGNGQVDLMFPRAFWHVFEPEGESPYGQSILKGAHSPWADKWLNGGALDVRRLFAHKDAYGGVDISFPPGTTPIDGKEEVPNQNIAREMAEQIKAGAVTTRPSERDVGGNDRWTITRATIPASPTHIFEYPKDLDAEMLNGIEIPDDVIKSEATGAWQGKQVPMQAFYTNGDRWLAQVVEVIVTQILEPLVLINWGKAVGFEVCTKPLAEQIMDQIKQAETPEHPQDGGGGPPGFNAPSPFGGRTQAPGQPGLANTGNGSPPRRQRFSTEPNSQAAELLVARGVLDAAGLVKAGRRLLGEGNSEGDPIRMAAEHAPTGGVTIQGKQYKGGQFIPAEVMAKATPAEKAAVKGEEKDRSERLTPKEIKALLNTQGMDIRDGPFDHINDTAMYYLKHEGEEILFPVDKISEMAMQIHESGDDGGEFEMPADIARLFRARKIAGRPKPKQKPPRQASPRSGDADLADLGQFREPAIGRPEGIPGIVSKQSERLSAMAAKNKMSPEEVAQSVGLRTEYDLVQIMALAEVSGYGTIRNMLREFDVKDAAELQDLLDNKDKRFPDKVLRPWIESLGATGPRTQVDLDQFRLATAHAPAGGVTIQGKHFKGGEFIPAEVMAQATSAERAALKKNGGPQDTDKATDKEAKFAELLKTKTPEDAEAFRRAKADGIAIPPAWTEVTYYGADQDIRAEGRDAVGRKQRAENPAYRQRLSDENNARIKRDLMPKMDELRNQLRDEARAGNEEAKVLYLLSQTGFRIGGKPDPRAKVAAYGGSTLRGEHVNVEGDTVTFDFPGKKGVRQQHAITDPVIADMMRDSEKGAAVFNTRPDKIRAAWKRLGGAKVHDIRHVVASEEAQRIMATMIPPMPTSKKQVATIIKRTAAGAAKRLGNNPSQALSTYIDPTIFDEVRRAT